jgi:hypothetical protein
VSPADHPNRRAAVVDPSISGEPLDPSQSIQPNITRHSCFTHPPCNRRRDVTAAAAILAGVPGHALHPADRRRLAADRACLESAALEATLRGSRLSARDAARDRFADGFFLALLLPAR